MFNTLKFFVLFFMALDLSLGQSYRAFADERKKPCSDPLTSFLKEFWHVNLTTASFDNSIEVIKKDFPFNASDIIIDLKLKIRAKLLNQDQDIPNVFTTLFKTYLEYEKEHSKAHSTSYVSSYASNEIFYVYEKLLEDLKHMKSTQYSLYKGSAASNPLQRDDYLNLYILSYTEALKTFRKVFRHFLNDQKDTLIELNLYNILVLHAKKHSFISTIEQNDANASYNDSLLIKLKNYLNIAGSDTSTDNKTNQVTYEAQDNSLTPSDKVHSSTSDEFLKQNQKSDMNHVTRPQEDTGSTSQDKTNLSSSMRVFTQDPSSAKNQFNSNLIYLADLLVSQTINQDEGRKFLDDMVKKFITSIAPYYENLNSTKELYHTLLLFQNVFDNIDFRNYQKIKLDISSALNDQILTILLKSQVLTENQKLLIQSFIPKSQDYFRVTIEARFRYLADSIFGKFILGILQQIDTNQPVSIINSITDMIITTHPNTFSFQKTDKYHSFPDFITQLEHPLNRLFELLEQNIKVVDYSFHDLWFDLGAIIRKLNHNFASEVDYKAIAELLESNLEARLEGGSAYGFDQLQHVLNVYTSLSRHLRFILPAHGGKLAQELMTSTHSAIVHSIQKTIARILAHVDDYENFTSITSELENALNCPITNAEGTELFVKTTNTRRLIRKNAEKDLPQAKNSFIEHIGKFLTQTIHVENKVDTMSTAAN